MRRLGFEGIVSKRIGSRYVWPDKGMVEDEEPEFRAVAPSGSFTPSPLP